MNKRVLAQLALLILFGLLLMGSIPDVGFNDGNRVGIDNEVSSRGGDPAAINPIEFIASNTVGVPGGGWLHGGAILHNNTHVLAGADVSGVFASADSGMTWKPWNTGLLNDDEIMNYYVNDIVAVKNDSFTGALLASKGGLYSMDTSGLSLGTWTSLTPTSDALYTSYTSRSWDDTWLTPHSWSAIHWDGANAAYFAPGHYRWQRNPTDYAYNAMVYPEGSTDATTYSVWRMMYDDANSTKARPWLATDVDAYTVGTALSTDNIDSVVVDKTIPAGTPATGVLRVTDNNAVIRTLRYDGWATDAFGISTANGAEDFNSVNADVGNTVTVDMFGQLDDISVGISGSDTLVLGTSYSTGPVLWDGDSWEQLGTGANWYEVADAAFTPVWGYNVTGGSTDQRVVSVHLNADDSAYCVLANRDDSFSAPSGLYYCADVLAVTVEWEWVGDSTNITIDSVTRVIEGFSRGADTSDWRSSTFAYLKVHNGTTVDTCYVSGREGHLGFSRVIVDRNDANPEDATWEPLVYWESTAENIYPVGGSAGVDIPTPTWGVQGIFELMTAPNNSSMAIAHANSRLYKTTDAGDSWSFESFLAFDPSDSTRFKGTGFDETVANALAVGSDSTLYYSIGDIGFHGSTDWEYWEQLNPNSGGIDSEPTSWSGDWWNDTEFPNSESGALTLVENWLGRNTDAFLIVGGDIIQRTSYNKMFMLHDSDEDGTLEATHITADLDSLDNYQFIGSNLIWDAPDSTLYWTYRKYTDHTRSTVEQGLGLMWAQWNDGTWTTHTDSINTHGTIPATNSQGYELLAQIDRRLFLSVRGTTSGERGIVFTDLDGDMTDNTWTECFGGSADEGDVIGMAAGSSGDLWFSTRGGAGVDGGLFLVDNPITAPSTYALLCNDGAGDANRLPDIPDSGLDVSHPITYERYTTGIEIAWHLFDAGPVLPDPVDTNSCYFMINGAENENPDFGGLYHYDGTADSFSQIAEVDRPQGRGTFVWTNAFATPRVVFGTGGQGMRWADAVQPPAPAQVANLTAASSDGQIALAWDDNTETLLSNYSIYRGTEIGKLAAIDTIASAFNEYADRTVTNDIGYYYYVRAIDSYGGIGTASSTVYEVPDGTGPEAAVLALNNRGTTYSNIHWSPNQSADFDYYQVWRDAKESGTPVLFADSVSDTFYADSTLAADSTFTYAIAAFDSAGNSTMSNEVAATKDTTAPDQVADAALTSRYAESAGLSWDYSGAADLLNYWVYRGTTSGSLSYYAAVGTDSVSFREDGLTPATDYFYAVVARDSSLNGGTQSAEVDASADTGLPDAPGEVTAIGATSQITINWDQSVAADINQGLYKIYRAGVRTVDPAPSEPFSLFDDEQTTSYVDTNPAASDSTWYYYVTATDSTGNESLVSATVSEVLSGMTFDSFVVDAFAQDDTTAGGLAIITVSDAGITPAGYVRVRTRPHHGEYGAAWSDTASGGFANAWVDANGVQAEFDSTYTTQIPVAHTNPDSSVDLTWTDNSDNESYFELQHNVNDAGWVIVDSEIPAGTTAWTHDNTHTPAPRRGKVYYRVRAIGATDVSDWATANSDSALYNQAIGVYSEFHALPTAGAPTPWTDIVVSNEVEQVYISAQPVPGAPIADFSLADQVVELVGVGVDVLFEDASTGSPTSWLWSFGDGKPTSYATAEDTTYTYTEAGTYDIALTATNATGPDTKTEINYLQVNADIIAPTTLPGALVSIGWGDTTNTNAHILLNYNAGAAGELVKVHSRAKISHDGAYTAADTTGAFAPATAQSGAFTDTVYVGDTMANVAADTLYVQFQFRDVALTTNESAFVNLSSPIDTTLARAVPGGGPSGTINSWADLAGMSLSGTHTLGADLDSTTTGYDTYIRTGTGWAEIGTSGSEFTGSFDGQGYSISDLVIGPANTSTQGSALFGHTNNATIANLALLNVSGRVGGTVGGYIGAFVGVAGGTTAISNCYSTGTLHSSNYAGGFIGMMTASGGVIDDCWSSVSLTAGPSAMGGFIGRSLNGTYTNCFATGDVAATGSNYGGFSGQAGSGTITNCGWFKSGTTGAVYAIASSSGDVTYMVESGGTSPYIDDTIDWFWLESRDLYDTSAPTWDFTNDWDTASETQLPVLRSGAGS